MFLYKDGITREVTDQSTINVLISAGYKNVEDPIKAAEEPISDQVENTPTKRGRLSKEGEL